MTSAATSVEQTGESIRDWLLWNDLTLFAVHNKLQDCRLEATSSCGPQHGKTKVGKLDAVTAWDWSAKALAHKFPVAQKLINKVKADAELLLVAEEGVRPFTVDQGQGEFPRVTCPWGLEGGSAEQLLLMAHEFTHAVQLVVSQAPCAPLSREICAFTGERALIAYLRELLPDLGAELDQVWQQHNRLYLGEHTARLAADLTTADCTYRYNWNYPLARLAVCQISDPAESWQIFQKGHRADAYQTYFRSPGRNPGERGALPAVKRLDGQGQYAQAYQQLGMVAALDLQYRFGRPEASVAEYFLETVSSMQERRLLVVTDDERQPTGYIAFVDEGDLRVSVREVMPTGALDRFRKAFEDFGCANKTIRHLHED